MFIPPKACDLTKIAHAVAPGAMDTPLLLGASKEFREKMLAAYVAIMNYFT